MPAAAHTPRVGQGLTPAPSFATDEGGARYWKNAIPTNIDSEAAEIGAAAGIDMFGSNTGLIKLAASGEEAMLDEDVGYSEEEDDPYGLELEDEEEEEAGPSGVGGVPAGARQRMDEQAAYICQLEETNLKLQERIYLLEAQLDSQRGRGWTEADDGGGSALGHSDSPSSDANS